MQPACTCIVHGRLHGSAPAYMQAADAFLQVKVIPPKPAVASRDKLQAACMLCSHVHSSCRQLHAQM